MNSHSLFKLKIFLFLYFSYRNSPVYPPGIPSYAQSPTSYPQFKKVFSPFGKIIHTCCAERIRGKYFAGRSKLQNAVLLPEVGIRMRKRRPATAINAVPALFFHGKYEKRSIDRVVIWVVGVRLLLFRRGLPALSRIGFGRIGVGPRLTRMTIYVAVAGNRRVVGGLA